MAIIMRIQRWKHSSKKQHLLGFIQGFAQILDGCVIVLSLGFYMSSFEMTIACYRARAHIEQLKTKLANDQAQESKSRKVHK